MCRCKNWTIKKAECRRIDAFKLWCWTRLLSPLDCKEIKPVDPKVMGKTCEAEAPVLRPSDVKSRVIGKDPDAGKDWRQKVKGLAEHEIVSIIDSKDVTFSKLWETVEDRGTWHASVHGVTKNQIQLSNWTTTTTLVIIITFCPFPNSKMTSQRMMTLWYNKRNKCYQKSNSPSKWAGVISPQMIYHCSSI